MKWFEKLSELLAKEQVKKLLYYIAAFVAILGIVFIMVKARVQDEIIPYATFVENDDEEQFVRDLTSGMTLEQKFTSPRDFEVITLSCSNHEKSLAGYMELAVYDHQGEQLTSKTVQNQGIAYGVPLEIPMDGKKGETYLVRVSAYDTGEEAIGFFGYVPEKGDNTAVLDGKKSEYALSIGIHNYTGLFRNLLKLILIVMFAGLIVLLAALWRRELPPEKVFLILVIPIGIALLCFLSVNFINDGEAHFARAYHYANVVLGVAEDQELNRIAMRADDVDTLYSSGFMKAQHAQNMYHIYENWKWFVEDDTLVYVVDWRNVGNTNIVGYLPSVIGILIARILHLGTYPMVYLAKIFAFGGYLVGCYYAIKITPIGKHMMVFIAALPMAIQQATGITYDNVTYIVLFLLISVYLQIYFEGVSRKRVITIVVLCMLLGACKGGIYTPMLWLLLFISKGKIGGWKKKIALIIGIGILTTGVMFTGYGSTIIRYLHPDENIVSAERMGTDEQKEVSGDENSGKEMNAQNSTSEEKVEKYDVGYVFRSPAEFIKLVINTLIERTQYYLEGIEGRMAAWAVEQLPMWSCMLFAIVILLAKNGVNEQNYKVDPNLRMALLSTFGLIMFAFLSLFLIETPLYHPFILGIQGRYFIPVLLMLGLGLRNNWIIQKKNSENALYIVYYGQMILFVLGYFLVFMTQVYD